MTVDEEFMREAIREARKGVDRTHPNPAVGAVIVTRGKVIARGWHRGAGNPHAEIEALKRAGRRFRDATLYVTFEPCSTHGRTPPCTESIIRSRLCACRLWGHRPQPQACRARWKDSVPRRHTGMPGRARGPLRSLEHRMEQVDRNRYAVRDCQGRDDSRRTHQFAARRVVGSPAKRPAVTQ